MLHRKTKERNRKTKQRGKIEGKEQNKSEKNSFWKKQIVRDRKIQGDQILSLEKGSNYRKHTFPTQKLVTKSEE